MDKSKAELIRELARARERIAQLEEARAPDLHAGWTATHQAFLDAFPMPVFYKDHKFVYRGCNKAFEEFTGLKREQLLGKKTFDVAPGELAKRYDTEDAKLFNQGGTQTYTYKLVTTSGETRSVIFHKSLLETDDGVKVGILGVITDVTGR